MITVNGKEFPWEEGLTVNKLLKKKKYVYPRIIVKINGKIIKDEHYTDTLIEDGDNVQCLHLMAGG